MPKYEKNIIIKVTKDPGTADKRETDAIANLQNKLTNAEVYHIDDLPDFSGQDLSKTRIYVHGHADYLNRVFGGRQPKDVANKLLERNVKNPAVISLTGCNAARGRACREAAQRETESYGLTKEEADATVVQEYWNRDSNRGIHARAEAAKTPQDHAAIDQERRRLWFETQQDARTHYASRTYPGVNIFNVDAKKASDSRFVDTSKSAADLCIDSFAQVFHKELLRNDVSTTVKARLYVVSVDDEGRKRVQKTHYDDDSDLGGLMEYPKHHEAKSKIKITPAETEGSAINGQEFEFVDYPRAESADDSAQAQSEPVAELE